MTRWLLLAAAIASEVTGSLSLKGALERPALYAVVALAFLVAFALFAAVLRRGMPLGVAYGIWGAVGVVATAVLSAAIFDERLTPLMGLGIAIVVVGVLVVELASQAAQRRLDDEAGR
ncbi:Multidrug resistance protein, SMR family [metagenome]|uniref:Multidrug resistance protein, SMR family n=1 Tax=metagenome TaxID=256318 RepID=A0A2P2CC89_9ZZZZ